MSNRPITVVANLYPTIKKPYLGTFVKNAVDEFTKNGLSVDVIALPNFGSGLSGYLKFYFAAFFNLLRFDGIVYVHYVSHSVLPVLLSQYLNSKLTLVLHYHGSDAFPEGYESPLRCKLKRFICKWANSKAQKVITPSLFFAERLVQTYNLPAQMVTTSASGGVDPKVFYSLEKTNHQNNKILFASRMLEGKGCLIAADAAISLAKIDSTCMFTFVGDGPCKEQVREKLQTLIDDGRCELLPAVNQTELAEHFRQSDFFLFPSFREGESLGLVVVEAMSCGSIPIAINQAAIKEIMGKETWTLCDNTKQFAAKLATVYAASQSDLEAIRIYLINRASLYDRSAVSAKLIREFNKLGTV